MKATHIFKGSPVAFLNIRFRFDAAHIEYAIISIYIQGQKPTKKAVKQEIINMLMSGGSDGASDWISEKDYEDNIESCKTIAKILFPSFYNS